MLRCASRSRMAERHVSGVESSELQAKIGESHEAGKY
jgi:hypothetical protein